jgi:hypothetical protein
MLKIQSETQSLLITFKMVHPIPNSAFEQKGNPSTNAKNLKIAKLRCFVFGKENDFQSFSLNGEFNSNSEAVECCISVNLEGSSSLTLWYQLQTRALDTDDMLNLLVFDQPVQVQETDTIISKEQFEKVKQHLNLKPESIENEPKQLR